MKFEPQGSPVGKILVINDNPMIYRLVGALFRKCGYQVLVTDNLDESLKIIRQEQLNLILIDLNFPSQPDLVGSSAVNGNEVLAWVHRLDEARHIPKLVVGSDEPAAGAAKAFAAGAFAYLPKPIEAKHIVNLVLENLAPRRAPLPNNLAAALKLSPV